ncbi:MAG: RNA methyltransferase [Thermoanaerobaculales bacterium]|nr:RNA methyltransferase [Thermoanaerobaculales bacterium]
MLYIGKKSARVKDLRRLIRHRAEGEVIIDGRRLLEDLIRWDVRILELYLAAGLSESPEVAPWITAAEQVFEMDAEVLAGVAPTRTPQGVLAVVEAPQWPVWPASEGVGLYLEGVQDPGNVGAIVRSAAGLGAAAVLLAPGCADPWGPAAVRGSAGTVFRIPVEWNVPLSRAVDRLRRHGGEVWATGNEGQSLSEWSPSSPMLLMLGAEGRGLSPEASVVADHTVSIPLRREVESLNVAVAAGILLSTLSE